MEDLISNLGNYIYESPFIAFVVAFIAGIITSFTPCVYPVIPITVGVIGGMAKGSRSKAFIYSLFYVLGIAVTYAGLGAFAALTGRVFGQLAGTPWPYIIVGNICIFLSLVTFEVIPFRLPGFIARLGSRTHSGTGIITIFLLGLISGVLVGPCTMAPLGVILSFVATKQNVLYGVLLLFTFAIGMGILLIIVGTFTGLITSLPKAGRWTKIVQKLIAWLLLIVGELLLIKAGMVWY